MHVKFWSGRLKCVWKDNIKTNPRAIDWEGADWMQLAQDKVQLRDLANTVMNFRFHRRRGIS